MMTKKRFLSLLVPIATLGVLALFLVGAQHVAQVSWSQSLAAPMLNEQDPSVPPEPENFVADGTPEDVDAAYARVGGIYSGTVAISEPLAIGVFDLSLQLNSANRSISGRLVISGSEAFAGAAGGALAGRITGASITGASFFTLHVPSIVGTVSSRNVMRELAFQGVMDKNGNVMKGTYTEVIRGYTPRPITVRGTFLVARAVSGGNSDLPILDHTLFMPSVLSNSRSSAADTLTPEVLEQNPMPPVPEPTIDVIPLEVPVPVPDAQDDALETPEMQPEGVGVNLYLPAIGQ